MCQFQDIMEMVFFMMVKNYHYVISEVLLYLYRIS